MNQALPVWAGIIDRGYGGLIAGKTASSMVYPGDNPLDAPGHFKESI